jgi:hypothetical protein
MESEPDPPAASTPDTRLAAYIVPASGKGEVLQDSDRQEEYLTEIRSYLKERLPEYMLPSALVVLDSLPMTPNGKVDRNALPQPNAIQSLPRSSFTPPVSTDELAIAAVWADLLGMNQFDVQDNFFELGGHSLLVTRMLARLSEIFSVDLPIAGFFQAPCIAGLAKLAQSARWAAERPQSVRAGIDDQERETIEL